MANISFAGQDSHSPPQHQGLNNAELEVERFKKWPKCHGSPKREHEAILEQKTEEIRIHYVNFTASFKNSFLKLDEQNKDRQCGW